MDIAKEGPGAAKDPENYSIVDISHFRYQSFCLQRSSKLSFRILLAQIYMLI